MAAILSRPQCVNSLRPTIWQQIRINIGSGNEWLVAWWHQAITWTNVDSSSVKSCGIHRRAILLQMLKIWITGICCKIIPNCKIIALSLREQWVNSKCEVSEISCISFQQDNNTVISINEALLFCSLGTIIVDTLLPYHTFAYRGSNRIIEAI